MFEFTINVFSLGSAIVTILAFVFGGIKFVTMVQSQAVVTETRLVAVEKELSKLSDVTIRMAESAGRMNLLEDRQIAQGKRLDSTVEIFSKRLDALSNTVMKALMEKKNG